MIEWHKNALPRLTEIECQLKVLRNDISDMPSVLLKALNKPMIQTTLDDYELNKPNHQTYLDIFTWKSIHEKRKEKKDAEKARMNNNL